MGVWIETIKEANDFIEVEVTPCVGVWIETPFLVYKRATHTRHTLRGCVD